MNTNIDKIRECIYDWYTQMFASANGWDEEIIKTDNTDTFKGMWAYEVPVNLVGKVINDNNLLYILKDTETNEEIDFYVDHINCILEGKEYKTDIDNLNIPNFKSTMLDIMFDECFTQAFEDNYTYYDIYGLNSSEGSIMKMYKIEDYMTSKEIFLNLESDKSTVNDIIKEINENKPPVEILKKFSIDDDDELAEEIHNFTVIKDILQIDDIEDIIILPPDVEEDTEDFVNDVLVDTSCSEELYYSHEFAKYVKEGGDIRKICPHFEMNGMVYFIHMNDDGFIYLSATDGSVIRVYYFSRQLMNMYCEK